MNLNDYTEGWTKHRARLGDAGFTRTGGPVAIRFCTSCYLTQQLFHLYVSAIRNGDTCRSA